MDRASEASTTRSVSRMSAARALPTTRGSAQDMPPSEEYPMPG
ncbi:Uncharacterised protein [Mycobacteroides abscessus subsp. abscessus]|nr:Uncharacterised protein [Mycobacteroides abscessus subsp. abscessus]